MPLDVEALSDAELRSELVAAGINAGPITGTTRKIYESKLLKLQKGGSKVQAKSAKAATPKQTPKPVPKPVATPKITAPSKPKTPAKSLNRTLDTSTRVASSSSRRFNSSEVEDEESDDDEILAPVKTKTPNRKPISSTPTKDVTPVKTVTKEYSSSYSTNRSESPSFHIPNLITDFTPSLSRLSDHPGATPPRKAKSVSRSVTTVFSPQYTPNSFAQKNRFADLGATSAEEDDDDDGVETSRVIYNSNETGPTRRGLVGKAWDKVLGYDFRASTKPGENYDFQTGRTRTSVRKDPRTGMPRVYQTSVVSDWLKIILTSLVILAVLLTIAFVVTQPKETFTSSYAAFKKTVRDTGNFFYRYAILPVISGLVVVALAVGGFFGYKKYKEVKEQEEQELIDLVERIFSIIKDAKNEGEPYVSQPHVRDIIFPPIKRRGADLKRWESAVDFIDKHDSRVTTEVRVTASGNECPVWIWVGVETKGKRYH